MRRRLSELDGRRFDIVVIGGGISGASSAQHLVAAGYDVLLVEKGDFGGAATSRSGRLLHCGLRYLAPTYRLSDFLKSPRQLLSALEAARRSIRTSSQFIATTPERAGSMRLIFAITGDMPYRAWHVKLGAWLLERLGRGRQKLDCRSYGLDEAVRSLPFVEWLRDKDRVKSVVTFVDHHFRWPERICMDAVLDAERLGATVRNYTTATAMDRQADGRWRVTLADSFDPSSSAGVEAPVILNMAGPWIDAVNRTAKGAGAPPRKVVAVKGVHILVRLPERCRGHGIMGTNRHGEAITCMPWGDLHYVGPTETLYEGDIDDVRPLEEDIDFILGEVNHLMPGIALARKDVLQAWAGVRPITYDPALPKGRRMPFSVLHDLGEAGLPNVLTLTWAAIMFHRSAAEEVVGAVRRKIKPSRETGSLSYEARHFPDNQNSPPVVDHYPDVKLADMRYAAETEHARTLEDLIFRRTGLGWNAAVTPEAVRRVAETVAPVLGWDEDRMAQEIEAFLNRYSSYHLQDGRSVWRI